MVLKRTRCDVWQLECRASSVTAIVQSDHVLHQYILSVFSKVFSYIVHHTYCAEIQPTPQQAAAASLNMSMSIHAHLL